METSTQDMGPSIDQVLSSVKKSFAEKTAAGSGSPRVASSPLNERRRQPARYQPLPSPPYPSTPVKAQTRRPKLPPVPSVLQTRERTQRSPRDSEIASPRDPRPVAVALRTDVPDSVNINPVSQPSNPLAVIAPEHRWGERNQSITAHRPAPAPADAAIAPQASQDTIRDDRPLAPDQVSEIQLRKSNKHTIRTVRRNVSESPTPSRADAMHKAGGPSEADWDRLKSSLYSVIDSWVDRQKADPGPAR